jgi:hypothetical protein
MLASFISVLAFSTAMVVSAAPFTAVATAPRLVGDALLQPKRDSMTVIIEPAKRVEVKLVMKKGEKADFEWRSTAEVGYNLHGEVPTDPSVKAHVYQRGSSRGEKGNVEAVFDGVHGWSFRNNTEQSVTVTVKASGQFSALKKM